MRFLGFETLELAVECHDRASIAIHGREQALTNRHVRCYPMVSISSARPPQFAGPMKLVFASILHGCAGAEAVWAGSGGVPAAPL